MNFVCQLLISVVPSSDWQVCIYSVEGCEKQFYL